MSHKVLDVLVVCSEPTLGIATEKLLEKAMRQAGDSMVTAFSACTTSAGLDPDRFEIKVLENYRFEFDGKPSCPPPLSNNRLTNFDAFVCLGPAEMSAFLQQCEQQCPDDVARLRERTWLVSVPPFRGQLGNEQDEAAWFEKATDALMPAVRGTDTKPGLARTHRQTEPPTPAA